MKGKDIIISVYPTQPAVDSFNDTIGHWAEKYIKDLASRNIVKGCGNGSYRPDQPLSRAEFTAMIARLQNLTVAVMKEQSNFKDYRDIPWWALEAVLAAREEGLISGCPDGSFQPNRAITRSEMEMIISRMDGRTLINLFPGQALQPNRAVTRAEAAAVLDQL